jgi:pantoate--beta-alanine ligase
MKQGSPNLILQRYIKIFFDYSKQLALGFEKNSMKIIESKNELIAWRELMGNQSIGFVPTMGALHNGHLNLIKTSMTENPLTVVSIFINPTQFNNKSDFIHYPKDTIRDINLLKNSGVDLLFLPSVEEMYELPDVEVFDHGVLTSVLEAQHRPGHFNGVITIIHKLFDLVRPVLVYMGQKDLQQLAIVKAWVDKNNRPEKIIGCDTTRETSGLAMSSRNSRLSKNSREIAANIFKILTEIKLQTEDNSPELLEQWGRSKIHEIQQFKLEYLEIIDSYTFSPLLEWDKNKSSHVVTAIWIEGVRLIDNLKLT